LIKRTRLRQLVGRGGSRLRSVGGQREVRRGESQRSGGQDAQERLFHGVILEGKWVDLERNTTPGERLLPHLRHD
jgi:hypothetical protein